MDALRIVSEVLTAANEGDLRDVLDELLTEFDLEFCSFNCSIGSPEKLEWLFGVEVAGQLAEAGSIWNGLVDTFAGIFAGNATPSTIINDTSHPLEMRRLALMIVHGSLLFEALRVLLSRGENHPLVGMISKCVLGDSLKASILIKERDNWDALHSRREAVINLAFSKYNGGSK